MDDMITLGENNGTGLELAQRDQTGEKSVKDRHIGESGARPLATIPHRPTGGAPFTQGGLGEERSGRGPETTTPPDAGEDKTTGAEAPRQEAADRRAAWQALVDGEYKDLFTQDTQRIINARFKHVKGLEQQLSEARGVLEQVMDRLGIDHGDMDKLRQRLDRARDSRAGQERVEQMAREQMARWGQQARRLQELYPDFDLRREMAGEAFRALVTNPAHPVSLRQAYEVVHLEDIKAQVARRQAQTTEQRVVDSIRARGARPSENGTSGQSGFTVREDVSRLTDRQLADIRARVMRGERISFG